MPDKIRIAIFGGSFNPIHKGHVAIAQAVCQSGMVDEVWLMVSPQNPLKQNADLMPDELRLEMAKVAVRYFPQMKVSDFEFQLPRPSYMLNTLTKLREVYPNRDFLLIIGADNWICFPQWYHYEEILDSFELIVYPRENYNFDVQQLPENVHYLSMPILSISSTELRQQFSQGKINSPWIDDEVKKIWLNYKKCQKR